VKTSPRSKTVSGGFAVFLLVLGFFGYRVGRAAQDAILESRSGSISEFSLDPTAAGFRAFTEVTPTALVVHTAVADAGGADLVGVTLLTAADGDAGGTVVTVPRTFIDPDGTGLPLSEIFVTQGLDALTAELRSTFAIAFADVVVLDASSWTSLMRADLPLDLTLREDLVRASSGEDENRVLVASGTRAFDLLEVATIAAHRNPGEPGLGVALRHQAVWQSWISRTAASADRPELFDLDSGFTELIGSLASAEVSYRVVPSTTKSAADPADTTYIGNSSEIADLISRIVPFPESAETGSRPEVLLLDASFGAVDSAPIIESIVRAGGRVTILGNAEVGSDAIAEVQVHEDAAVPIGEQIAERLGFGPVRIVPLDDATASITVAIGADLVDGQ